MKRVFGVLVVVLLLGLAGIAVAQTEGGAGLVRPLVVSIEQAVPVELTLAVAQGDGAVVTMTAPITVAVGLRIRIDGDQVVAVAPVENAASPVVAVEAAPVMAPASGEGFQSGDFRWSVVGAENAGTTFDLPDDMYKALETTGTFIVVEFEVENTGKAPAGIGSDMQIYLKDDAERRFDTQVWYFGDACYFVELNPGLSQNCRLVFEAPAAAQGFVLVMDDAGEVPLMAE